jgi:hypothetical protein
MYGLRQYHAYAYLIVILVIYLNLPHTSPNLRKYIPLNPAPQDPSNNTKGTSQTPLKISVLIQFNF